MKNDKPQSSLTIKNKAHLDRELDLIHEDWIEARLELILVNHSKSVEQQDRLKVVCDCVKGINNRSQELLTSLQQYCDEFTTASVPPKTDYGKSTGEST